MDTRPHRYDKLLKGSKRMNFIDAIFGRRPKDAITQKPTSAGPSDLEYRASVFQRDLKRIKGRISDISWYPYETLTAVDSIQQLLRMQGQSLLDLVGAEPVLDVGCGDGDMSFFMESMGCRVDAIDYPAMNFNGMRGVRRLKAELKSTVDIRSVELDSQFSPPEQAYGLALLFGVLYHLKDPFYTLETLAGCSRHCFLSTRIAGLTPDGRVDLRRIPVAYLVGEGELNSAATNNWIFSQSGLLKLIERTHWEVCQYFTTGDTFRSDPLHAKHDERAFLLLKSRIPIPSGVRLLHGWHPVEYGAWRWTERTFSVLCQISHNRPISLSLNLSVPELLLSRYRAITLSATANGAPLGHEIYDRPGEYTYARELPSRDMSSQSTVVTFELDGALPPDDADERERGIIVTSIDCH